MYLRHKSKYFSSFFFDWFVNRLIISGFMHIQFSGTLIALFYALGANMRSAFFFAGGGAQSLKFHPTKNQKNYERNFWDELMHILHCRLHKNRWNWWSREKCFKCKDLRDSRVAGIMTSQVQPNLTFQVPTQNTRATVQSCGHKKKQFCVNLTTIKQNKNYELVTEIPSRVQ